MMVLYRNKDALTFTRETLELHASTEHCRMVPHRRCIVSSSKDGQDRYHVSNAKQPTSSTCFLLLSSPWTHVACTPVNGSCVAAIVLSHWHERQPRHVDRPWDMIRQRNVKSSEVNAASPISLLRGLIDDSTVRPDRMGYRQ